MAGRDPLYQNKGRKTDFRTVRDGKIDLAQAAYENGLSRRKRYRRMRKDGS